MIMFAPREREASLEVCEEGKGILEGTPTWEGNVLNGLGALGNSTGSSREVRPGLRGQLLCQANLLPRPLPLPG